MAQLKTMGLRYTQNIIMKDILNTKNMHYKLMIDKLLFL